LYEQAAQRSLEIRPDQIEALDPLSQLDLLSERLAQAGLMPQRSRSADLLGMVRTFEAGLRTHYCPRNIYPDPVRLVLASDPKNGREANEKSFESRGAGWRRWAPNLTIWHSPGNHMTLLRQPHVAVLSEWLTSTFSQAGSRPAL
jgi:thioesterase domain-containing protein